MIALAVVPLLVGLAAALCVRCVASRLSPVAATVLLTALALTVALATGLLLCVWALVALRETLPLSILGHWSPDVLRDNIPLPPEAGALGGLIATALLASATVHAGRVLMKARRTSIAAADLRPTAGDLVLVDDPAVFAYAIPGRHRRIVTSTGMVRTLTAPQRRALLAHEEAHLRHRHHVYVQLGRLAAAANPLMRPVSRAIDLSVERWADEAAVNATGDRATVARALTAAALAHAAVPTGTLAAAHGDVVERVRGLLRPPRRRDSLAFVLAVSAIACWLAAGLVVTRVHDLMELAERVAAH